VGDPLSIGGPTLSRVRSTNLRLWGEHVVSFEGGSRRCGPQGIVFFIMIFIPSRGTGGEGVIVVVDLGWVKFSTQYFVEEI
jgi:hypothetical protein